MLRPMVQGPIEAALVHSDQGYAVDDILSMCVTEEAQLWCAWDTDENEIKGTMVTQLRIFPRRRVCMIWIFSGILKECIHLLPEFEDWARGEGCGVVQIQGRRGWIRALPGYHQAMYVTEKKLNGISRPEGL